MLDNQSVQRPAHVAHTQVIFVSRYANSVLWTPICKNIRLHDICTQVVVATNIAETSLTIDGIVYVIDPGMSSCLEMPSVLFDSTRVVMLCEILSVRSHESIFISSVVSQSTCVVVL